MRGKDIHAFEVYANLAKFDAYSKELAAKTLILENMENYSE